MIRSVAIETPDGVYAPIHDVQGNIIKLVKMQSGEVIELSKPGPFGENLTANRVTDWSFSGKYVDMDAGLIYFGNRFYSPTLRRWLTHDPARQSPDLHLYCFNNPFKYYDPDGSTSEQAQEHYDNARGALIDALQHSISSGLLLEACPPAAAIEFYNAVQSWQEMAHEYVAGIHEDELSGEG